MLWLGRAFGMMDDELAWNHFYIFFIMIAA